MPCKTLHLLLIIQLALLPSLFSQTNEQLRADLYALNANGTFSLYDGNLTMYGVNYSNAVDGMDAVKMFNFGENFGLLREPKTLAIERRQHITTSDTIFFRMWNMRQRSYKIELSLANLEYGSLSGVLEDKYLNTRTDLDLNGTSNLVFTITSDVASAASNRFRIIFSSPASAYKLLPISFTGIKAYGKNNNIDIEWAVENEKDIAQFQIQKSKNTRQFSTVGTIVLNGENVRSYKWTDLVSGEGNNFYRVSGIDLNGKIQYSNIIKVSAGEENSLVFVYPNPVVNGLINIQIGDQVKGIYTARLINSYGQVAHVTQLLHNGGNSAQSLQVNKNSLKGNYTLEIITPYNTKISRKILMQ